MIKLISLKTSEDLFNSLTVFFDTIQTSWQNSEDAERLRKCRCMIRVYSSLTILLELYDVLLAQLRTKTQLFNVECFKALFAFLGVDFNSPE